MPGDDTQVSESAYLKEIDAVGARAGRALDAELKSKRTDLMTYSENALVAATLTASATVFSFHAGL